MEGRWRSEDSGCEGWISNGGVDEGSQGLLSAQRRDVNTHSRRAWEPLLKAEPVRDAVSLPENWSLPVIHAPPVTFT